MDLASIKIEKKEFEEKPITEKYQEKDEYKPKEGFEGGKKDEYVKKDRKKKKGEEDEVKADLLIVPENAMTLKEFKESKGKKEETFKVDVKAEHKNEDTEFLASKQKKKGKAKELKVDPQEWEILKHVNIQFENQEVKKVYHDNKRYDNGPKKAKGFRANVEDFPEF